MLGRTAKFCGKRLVRRNVKVFRQNSTKSTDKTVPVVGFKMSSVSKEDKQIFNSFYPVIVKVLMESVKDMNVPEMKQWYSQMLEYNLLGGKQRRGLSVVLSYKLLEDPKKLTKENIRLANILGWSTELLTSYSLILDDIVDHSEMRRGVPCWYKVENVGLNAVTHAVVLEYEAYLILRKYFRDHPCYLSLCEIFHETVLRTFQGQILDDLSSSKNHENLQHFTMDRYMTIAQYKAGYMGLHFPVAAAMYLAGIQDAELHRKAASILHPLGIYTQIKYFIGGAISYLSFKCSRMIFLDCFGDVDTNGTTLDGDICEGKCAWSAVVALQRASPAQRAVMEKCYGRSDKQSVRAVVDVYRAVDLPTLFAKEEEEFLNKMRNQIEQMDPRLPKKVFYNILEML